MATFSAFQRFWVNAWPHRWRLHRHVPKFLKASPEPFRGEVLEIGAGRGWTSRQILETHPQVELTATDIDPRHQKYFEGLREIYGRRLKAREANVLKLLFDRDAFDVVIAINVLHYLQPYGVQKAVQEIIRVTRSGGLIGISDSTLLSPFATRNCELVERILQDEGCEILYHKTGNYYDIWARNPYPIETEKE